VNLCDNGLARTQEPTILRDVHTTNIGIGALTEIPERTQQEVRLMNSA
jgi:hypothetical protein